MSMIQAQVSELEQQILSQTPLGNRAQEPVTIGTRNRDSNDQEPVTLGTRNRDSNDQEPVTLGVMQEPMTLGARNSWL